MQFPSVFLFWDLSMHAIPRKKMHVIFYSFNNLESKCTVITFLEIIFSHQHHLSLYTPKSKLFVCVFSYSSLSWLMHRNLEHWVKMLATEAKNAENQTPSNFFFLWPTKVSDTVYKRDWHNVRSYLFFNVRRFWTKISDSVCKDL